LVSKYNNLYLAISPVKYSTFAYSICIITIFLLIRKRVSSWPKLLIICGNYSLGVYLIHLPILNYIASFMRQYKIIYSFQPLYQVIVTVLTLSVCLIIIEFTCKLLPKPFCIKLLGFGTITKDEPAKNRTPDI
jgi:peptidoglycan/LPS O-acetylase OafA/YrhL